MPVGRRALTGTGDRDVYRLTDLGVLLDGDDRRAVERRKRLGGNAVRRHAALAETLVAAAHGFHRHTGPFGDADACNAGRGGGAVVQSTKALQRSEPPDLVTSVRHLKGVDIE